ncbi:hypothetical protein PVA98_00660 [Achromobacter xylosoxidans]|nr:hypothetical protein [Achromobacter xylosoxidans]MDD7987672.1 hypothetical protein [Achromobacter xylosoxidans]OMG84089.1 hypothetical protein BIZ53_26740 [Achromobacter xylosoxidans]
MHADRADMDEPAYVGALSGSRDSCGHLPVHLVELINAINMDVSRVSASRQVDDGIATSQYVAFKLHEVGLGD